LLYIYLRLKIPTLIPNNFYVLLLILNTTIITYKNRVHPLYVEDPNKYTQRGKLRSPINGRFTTGTKLPHRKGPVPKLNSKK